MFVILFSSCSVSHVPSGVSRKDFFEEEECWEMERVSLWQLRKKNHSLIPTFSTHFLIYLLTHTVLKGLTSAPFPGYVIACTKPKMFLLSLSRSKCWVPWWPTLPCQFMVTCFYSPSWCVGFTHTCIFLQDSCEMVTRLIGVLLIAMGSVYGDISDRPVTIRLQPQLRKPNFMKEVAPPRPIQPPSSPVAPANRAQQSQLPAHPPSTPAAQLPVIPPVSFSFIYEKVVRDFNFVKKSLIFQTEPILS